MLTNGDMLLGPHSSGLVELCELSTLGLGIQVLGVILLIVLLNWDFIFNVRLLFTYLPQPG